MDTAVDKPMNDYDQGEVWRERDGTRIRIQEMSDQHLMNAISMLARSIDGERSRSVLVRALLAEHHRRNLAAYSDSWICELHGVYWRMCDPCEEEPPSGGFMHGSF